MQSAWNNSMEFAEIFNNNYSFMDNELEASNT